MKKIYFIFALGFLMISCKNEAKSTEKNGETTQQSEMSTSKTESTGVETISGLFLYLENENAAVLQSSGSTMYGVVINEQMHALDKQCDQYKKNEHDMVPVVIRGVRKPNPMKDAWKEVIEVKEILSVQAPSEDDSTIVVKK
ncbi:MAG: hypothetical protein AAF617_03940 [Bacteroidota bacterium]